MAPWTKDEEIHLVSIVIEHPSLLKKGKSTYDSLEEAEKEPWKEVHKKHNKKFNRKINRLYERFQMYMIVVENPTAFKALSEAITRRGADVNNSVDTSGRHASDIAAAFTKLSELFSEMPETDVRDIKEYNKKQKNCINDGPPVIQPRPPSSSGTTPALLIETTSLTEKQKTTIYSPAK